MSTPHPTKTFFLLIFAAALGLTGCHVRLGVGTSTDSTASAKSGAPARPPTALPSNAVVVGGGPDIVYHPPGSGTCVLVDEQTGRIIRTQSATTGDFQFNRYRAGDAQALQAAGVDPNDVRLVLYFVPDPKPGNER